ncbi:MAG: hypothetical protein EA380_05025 [Phycisphaeraceae bacterium]|nr:MAG: hypothetical protein EA380_05025 [Phycisphaeraceae bacterium]
MNLGLAALISGSLLCSHGFADVLWNNGGMVTHPGAGANGFDVSMASIGQPIGYSATRLAGQEHFRVADRFEVLDAWTVDSISVYAYQTNSTTPSWSGIELRLWDGNPALPGSLIVGVFTHPTIAPTQIYRVSNGSGNLGNTSRLIHTMTFDANSLALTSGAYWLDWTVTGSASIIGISGSAWATPVQSANPLNPNQPGLVWGSTLQLDSTGWQPLGIKIPFVIRGSGGSPCAADLTGDGVVDADDFFLFLQLFASGDPRADINEDGVIDADDFFGYLTLFAQGC